MNIIVLISFFLSFCILNGQEFSIESFINVSHKKEGSGSWFEMSSDQKNIFKSIRDSLRSEGIYNPEKISHHFPDSLAEKYFRIKNGIAITQLYDGEIAGKDTIDGFEMVWWSWSGDITFHFKLKHLLNYQEQFPSFNKKKYFYVIGDYEVQPIHFKLNKVTNKSVFLNKIMSSIKDEIKDNSKYNYYMMKFPQINNIDTLKSKLLEYCDLQYVSHDIDGDTKLDTILSVRPIKGKRPPAPGWFFSAMLFSSTNSVTILPFTYFENITKVDKQCFLMFKHTGAETGGRSINLYRFDKENKKLVRVFSEGFWTT